MDPDSHRLSLVPAFSFIRAFVLLQRCSTGSIALDVLLLRVQRFVGYSDCTGKGGDGTSVTFHSNHTPAPVAIHLDPGKSSCQTSNIYREKLWT